MFAPTISFSLVVNVFSILAIITNGGKILRVRIKGHRPKIEIDRLASLIISQSVERDCAIFCSIIFAISEKIVMIAKSFFRMLVAISETQLTGYWIGLNV